MRVDDAAVEGAVRVGGAAVEEEVEVRRCGWPAWRRRRRSGASVEEGRRRRRRSGASVEGEDSTAGRRRPHTHILFLKNLVQLHRTLFYFLTMHPIVEQQT